MSFHKVTPVRKSRKSAPAAKKQAAKPAPKHAAKQQRRRPVGNK
ncbi:hypothetical protein ACH4Y0_06415 [Streptomyces sp. NPDC020707]|jgi:hypothetical protein|uniref:Uncharacterized protein n=1 Tax=Streptomyces ortus TaxID=2867268 RepID=A0ABT3V5J1_9ACTN|nr:hypothetical protein [Streptomyces ortus]MCX4235244.1 hypothetical protein [Streptomyces ortus]